MPSDFSDARKEFGHRLRAARMSLGYTQQQMAYALGINFARYNKYEIGRSEAPYDVLCKIAQVADVDLNYLIAGQMGRRGRARETPADQLVELLQALPIAAVVYDKHRRLLAHNTKYRDLFFPINPRKLLRPGTPQDVLIRAWAHAHELDPIAIEACVDARFDSKRYAKNPVELQVGLKRLHIAETVEANKRLVLITDLSKSDRLAL
ncbi:MAG: helix-turn-helix domain-containing protein [Geminicoccaceae bacterium]